MNPPTTAPTPAVRKRRGVPLWIVIVVAMLLAHVVMMLGAVVVATSDGNFQVIPDYYRRAVNWDQTRALERASEKLGWAVTLEAEPTMTAGRRLVTLKLADAAGQPLADASVQASYFHDAHIAAGQVATFVAQNGGVYTATLPMEWEGFWTFELLARRGSDTFVATVSLYAADRK
jgi:nitrogen fixation protein FixH